MDELEKKRIAFVRAYRRFADEGRVEGLGTPRDPGEDYMRIKQEWQEAGCPEDVEGFIERRAQYPPLD